METSVSVKFAFLRCVYFFFIFLLFTIKYESISQNEKIISCDTVAHSL